MEELKRCPHEELTFAPYLWLRVRALEAWLNDRARQGWSLAAMDGHDALLVQDGARARYRAVLVRRQRGVNFDAAAADLLARRRAEGWSFVGACDGVHIFVDREGQAADFADADTAPTARRLAAGRAALAALPWLLLAAYFVIMRFSADGHGLLSGSPALILPILLLCAAVAAGAWLVRARRALKAEGKRGEAALFAAPRWRRALLVALCYIALLVVASVSPLLPDLLPDLWRGAPLTEAEAPLRTEAVYGVAGAFDSEAESGSFFVPRVSFYDEEAEGASIFGRVMDCRWPWVAERVLESQLGYASGYEIAEVDGATLYLWNDRDGGSDLVCLDGTRVLDLNLSPAIDMETLCAALKTEGSQ